MWMKNHGCQIVEELKTMRRKLIKQDAFDTIIKESATTAERELAQAEPFLAKAIGKGPLSLHSFNQSTAVYETTDNSYVHAGYQIKENAVTFNNIEELVIDETSRKGKMKNVLSEMIDQIVQDNHAKAKDLFNNYLGMVNWSDAQTQRHVNESKNHKTKSNREQILKLAKSAGDEFFEAYKVAQNVLDYVDYMKVGPALQESTLRRDEKGNVTDIRIPTVKERNESRLQKFDWKTLNPKIADARRKIPYFAENQEFCKSVANLKRQNAFSDEQGLEEALDHVVQNWPEVLFVTQEELSQLMGECLDVAGVNNWDDQTCSFMAEGILRKAQGAYSEKANQILHLASAPKMESDADEYEHFQSVVQNYYPAVDEKYGLERKAFADLYESLANIHKKADRQGDEALKHETASYLNELAAMLNGDMRPELEAAEDAAKFMKRVVETNVSGAGSWSVSNTPHLTVTGDHPQMGKNAKVDAVSGKYTGDWGDSAPMIQQDDMSYKGQASKTARKNSWGNEGGKDTFPSLNNPYVPKPYGDYTMKGEKGVDKDATGQHHSTWQSNDTWPNLKNPYVPGEAGGEGGKGHKMKDGSETDLVVDK